MATNWIGFRPVVKAPAGTERFVLKQRIRASASLGGIIPLFTSKLGLSRWFDEVISIDLRQGGALKLTGADGEQFGAAFAQLNIPKSLLLVTERWGGLEVKFREQDGETELRITVSRVLFSAEEPEWRNQVSERLRLLEVAIEDLKS